MNTYKKITLTLSLLTLATAALVIQAQRHVVTTYSIEIDTPVEEVWDFLSDNRNAKG
jgi:uncharacterized membrane protein